MKCVFWQILDIRMFQGGFQFFIEVLCILHDAFSLGGSVQVEFVHMIVIVTIFSVVIMKICET